MNAQTSHASSPEMCRPKNVGHGRRAANHRQAPFVEILEWWQRFLTPYLSRDCLTSVGASLHRYLGHTWQWLAIGAGRQREVSDDIDIGMVWNCEIGIDFDSP